MLLKALLFSLFLVLFSVSAMAGSGHDHGHSHNHSPVDQATATTKATKIVEELVKRNKLDQSWASIVASSVEKKEFKGNAEWLAIFVNDTPSDVEKRKLYVFLTLGGEYIAANFSGN